MQTKCNHDQLWSITEETHGTVDHIFTGTEVVHGETQGSLTGVIHFYCMACKLKRRLYRHDAPKWMHRFLALAGIPVPEKKPPRKVKFTL